MAKKTERRAGLPGTPTGKHDEKRKLDREHPELYQPCQCGRCSFTAHRVVTIKTKVGTK